MDEIGCTEWKPVTALRDEKLTENYPSNKKFE